MKTLKWVRSQVKVQVLKSKALMRRTGGLNPLICPLEGANNGPKYSGTSPQNNEEKGEEIRARKTQILSNRTVASRANVWLALQDFRFFPRFFSLFGALLWHLLHTFKGLLSTINSTHLAQFELQNLPKKHELTWVYNQIVEFEGIK